MSHYHLRTIDTTDPLCHSTIQQLDQLLDQEGLKRDQNLDYTVGLYDEKDRLLATGSCFQNTLRCLAVDSDHQGEGLLNQIVTNLAEYQYSRNILDLFVYTKYETAPFFADLGFYQVAAVEKRLVLMENKKDGFHRYLSQLKQQSAFAFGRQAAVVINANPFTLGHLHLLETAAKDCDVLHVFMVSEDSSLIPFSVRESLIRQGSQQIHNLIYHKTGNYLISAATFPSYFLRDKAEAIHMQALLDVTLFEIIAKSLGIQCRYVGEEPYSQVTAIYNQVMATKLEQAGITFVQIPRLQTDNTIISASLVRKLLQTTDRQAIKHLVPPSTYTFFASPEGETIIKKIKHSKDVTHY